MPTSCPRCATTIDGAEPLCSSCGWSAPYVVQPSRSKANVSFTERYRGTIYDSRPVVVQAPEAGLTRGRMIVALGFAAVLALFGMIIFAQTPY